MEVSGSSEARSFFPLYLTAVLWIYIFVGYVDFNFLNTLFPFSCLDLWGFGDFFF